MSSNTVEDKANLVTLDHARKNGMLIERIPLSQIDPAFLVRDRLGQDEDDLLSLMSSIRARGQTTPIEVADIGQGRFGLITGWRRWTALSRLFAQTTDRRFAEIRAMVVTPDTAQAAYQSMIEENEIRVNLSYYERARIALRAVQEGVFSDQRTALRTLYSASTRSKRSKIGTFMSVVSAFDGVLQHPTAITERLGLAMARELIRDDQFGPVLSARLRGAPIRTAAEEIRILARAVTQAQNTRGESAPEDGAAEDAPNEPKARNETVGAVRVRYDPGKACIDLAGATVDDAFCDELMAWIASRQR